MKNTKQKIVILALAVSLLGVGVFGTFLGGMEMHHYNCIATTLNGAACPEGNLAAALAFHINAFRGLGAVVFSEVFELGFAVLGFLTVLFFGERLRGFSALFFLKLRAFAARFGENVDSFPLRLTLLRWSALFLRSPSSLR